MPLRHDLDGPSSPTGKQWMIGHGRQQVVVAEVGATLRSYTVSGQPVIDGFGADEWSHSGRGQVLAPWPNRLGDGTYEFAGVAGAAPLNEVEKSNAIHGLVRWSPWDVEAHAQNVVVLTYRIHPMPAYPFLLDLRVEYRLGREGLSVTTTASNPGHLTLPFGLGFHPYLTVGTDRVDSSILHLPATQRLVLDERGLPTGEVVDVAGSEFDYLRSRSIGHSQMDTAFTGLRRDGDGLARASLRNPIDDRSLELWVDDRFSYLMCYTGDTIGDPDRKRAAVAIEPMTCPPDAFRSGDDLVVLEPNQAWEATWGLRPG